IPAGLSWPAPGDFVIHRESGAPAGFELHQPQTRLLVTAGDTLNLNCTTSGDVLIGGMKWLKVWGSRNETVYEQTGSFPRVTRVMSGSDTDFSIRISDVRPEDAGTYYCVKFSKSLGGDEEFRRGKGTEVSSRWEPALLALPTPPVVSGPNHRAGPGQSVSFTCTAGGF
uniref:Ig-like domain-containing protein n=1 Tax=Bubo bubo TaxID=30461 RepID=A0A8C0FL71_BUBBB